MFGFEKQPERVIKRSSGRAELYKTSSSQSSYQDDDDGLPQESILDDPQHKQQVANKAWNKYMSAKQIYETTRDPEHWQYMQKCITEYEKATKG